MVQTLRDSHLNWLKEKGADGGGAADVRSFLRRMTSFVQRVVH